MERLFSFTKKEMRIIRRRRTEEKRREKRELEREERMMPKLFTDIQIPQIPSGMIAVRFHGRLAFIPERGEGEDLFRMTPFTERQITAMNELKSQVNNGKRSEAGGIFGGHD